MIYCSDTLKRPYSYSAAYDSRAAAAAKQLAKDAGP